MVDLEKLATAYWTDPERVSESLRVSHESIIRFARQVAEAVKREDAKRCDIYIKVLDFCGHTAGADEVRHLQRHFIEDADDLKREIYGESRKEDGNEC